MLQKIFNKVVLTYIDSKAYNSVSSYAIDQYTFLMKILVTQHFVFNLDSLPVNGFVTLSKHV